MGALSWIAARARDPLYANGLALVANSALSAALGFVFWVVAARRFNADALGIGAAVVSAATLAALLGKAGFDAAVIRYAPACCCAMKYASRIHASAVTAARTTKPSA
jgi:O-antigen/teichoic acid export membrane protein